MKASEHEGAIVGGVVGLLLIGWLGFLVHRSPRFAGSGVGAVFGITGAVLMLIPLGYSIAKRIPFLHDKMTAHVSMQSLMLLHVYAGMLGPLFALIHTGHKFDSWMGMMLTAVMLLVVVTGFAVRHLLKFVAHDVTAKLALLQTARGDLDNAWGVLDSSATKSAALPAAPVLAATLASVGLDTVAEGPVAKVTRIAESVADLEYAVRMDEVLKRWFGRALKLHIAFSIALYVLLALHIASGIQFGLRWFQ